MFGNSGFTELEKKNKSPRFSSGNKSLDKLLKGGFHQDLIYLLYGDSRLIPDILQKTAVLSYRTKDFNKRVAYVDCNNKFNPYDISKLAVKEGFSPVQVLENILISRAFTWEQLVEVLENKIAFLENISILMVSGLTTFWPGYDLKSFEQLLKAVSGIKQVLFKISPLVILTCPMNKYSQIKPQGGKYLTHFGNVLVMINKKERNIEYSLIQHPFLAESQVIEWIPQQPKRRLKRPLKNTTMDQWF